MMETPDTTPTVEKSQPTDNAGPSGRIGTAAVVSLLLSLLIILGFIYDFSEVILARGNRLKVLESIPADARITQVERNLNEAGYNTLYIEGPPQSLQISTLRRYPLFARLLHDILPRTTPDNWLRETMSNRTRFYIRTDENGHIRMTKHGHAEAFFQPTSWPPAMTNRF